MLWQRIYIKGSAALRLVHFCNTVSPVLLKLVPPNLDTVLTRLQGTSTAIYGTLYLVENFAEILEAHDVLHYNSILLSSSIGANRHMMCINYSPRTMA